jgi:hypothetical protein
MIGPRNNVPGAEIVNKPVITSGGFVFLRLLRLQETLDGLLAIITDYPTPEVP